MTAAITLQELLTWNEEAASFWKAHLEAHPALLELPCDIGGTKNVREFVRHIWGVELRWSQQIAGLPQLAKEQMPEGPLEALYNLHIQAVQLMRTLLDDQAFQWGETTTLHSPWLPPEGLTVSRRKIASHALTHSQRHWAQLATLVRLAGFPSGFRGDLLLSSALL
ncbi:MAG: DinB family protein [Terracidiphilus sp.]